MATGTLSNVDLERLLGKEIFIDNYKKSNSNGGSTYNLTASQFAYYAKDKKKIYAVKDGKIHIPPHTTVLIQTEESIHVTNKICGTYHSKVSLVSKGLGHIGTTLDPMYFGTSKIAIQNITDDEQCIKVGQTFVSLMFHKTISKAKSRHDNGPGRPDVVSVDINELLSEGGEPIDDTIKEKLFEWCNKDHYLNIDSLKDIVQKNRRKSSFGKKEKKINFWSLFGSIAVSITPLILVLIHFFIIKIPIITTILLSETKTTLLFALYPLLWSVIKMITELIKNHIKGE